jgi:hypothetical protein
MKKPASYSGLEQVTTGAGFLPIFDHAAAFCVIDAGQLI